MSRDNPLSTTSSHYDKKVTASRGNFTQEMYTGAPKQSRIVQDYQRDIQQSASQMPSNYAKSVLIQGPQQKPKYQQILIERFRAKLMERGSTSLVGLARTFKIMDDSGDGQLD